MIARQLNNIVLILIILLSVSFYDFKVLGPLTKAAELMGVGLIIFLLILYSVYGNFRTSKLHFLWPVILILFSIFTSMIMANYLHDQDFLDTFIAQSALFYYAFYFLIQRIKPELKDIESMIIVFGLIYALLYYIQYFLYPTVLFEGYVRAMRGTIRIYISGGDYLVISLIMSVQRFLRTNRIKYLFLILLFYSVIILTGGRQMIAILGFVIVLFVLIDKKVRSRLFIIFLGLIGAFAIFIIFQEVFEALLLQSEVDVTQGAEYIRIKAASFFLTEFMRTPLAYITGHGAPEASTAYGKEMLYYAVNHGFYISDIGLIGSYVLYGAFFLLGVIGILTRVFRYRIQDQYIYLKYVFVAVVLSLLTGAGFDNADTIVAIILLLFMIDVSRVQYLSSQTQTDQVDMQN